MRLDDAPPAGWYPDPEGYSRLRWWEGTDWSERFRAPPTPSEFDLRGQRYSAVDDDEADVAFDPYASRVPGRPRADSEEIVNQVRMAAREEAERAAMLFSQQARAATSNITPLISQYTSKIIRWFRIASVIAIVLIAGWLAFQIFAQVSMFKWIGDRIDNLTDNSGSVLMSALGWIASG